jgi:hypothetical protein
MMWIFISCGEKNKPVLAQPNPFWVKKKEMHLNLGVNKLLSYLLLVTRYSLLVTCYLLLVTCYLLLVTCYLLLVTCYLLLVTCYLLLVTFYLLLVIFVTCYLLFVARCSLLVARYSCLVSHYSLLVTCYLTQWLQQQKIYNPPRRREWIRPGIVSLASSFKAYIFAFHLWWGIITFQCSDALYTSGPFLVLIVFIFSYSLASSRFARDAFDLTASLLAVVFTVSGKQFQLSSHACGFTELVLYECICRFFGICCPYKSEISWILISKCAYKKNSVVCVLF